MVRPRAYYELARLRFAELRPALAEAKSIAAPELAPRMRQFLETRPELRTFIHDPAKTGCAGRRLGSILDESKLRRVLARLLDEREFLSPYGIRSLSRCHASSPYVFRFGKQEYGVSYTPAESDSGMFGGNSNWRGPIWMPVNALIVRALSLIRTSSASRTEIVSLPNEAASTSRTKGVNIISSAGVAQLVRARVS